MTRTPICRSRSACAISWSSCTSDTTSSSIASGKRLDDVIGANPIAAVRRVRQPVREKQDPHAGTDAGSSRRFTIRAGTPAAITRSGSGRVTTAPAPTIVSRPTSASTTALLPIQLPAPMRTSRSAPGCSRIGADEIGAVRMRAARDVHAGREQHVALEVHVPEMAARSDVDVLVDPARRPAKRASRTRSPPTRRSRREGRARGTRGAGTDRGGRGRATAPGTIRSARDCLP